jgi:hypothetical protein
MDLGWREILALPTIPFAAFGVSPQRDGVVLRHSANTGVADATSIDFASGRHLGTGQRAFPHRRRAHRKTQA